MVAYTCNSSTRKDEAVESAVPGHPRLHRKFKVSLGYVVKRNFEKEKEAVFLMGPKPKYLKAFQHILLKGDNKFLSSYIVYLSICIGKTLFLQ